MNIQGKTYLITGGASGLGEATARLLTNGGARVVVADVNREKGEALAEELGSQAAYAQTDVTEAEPVEAAIQTALATFGGLHGAVNCAGVGLAMRTIGKQGPHDLDAFRTIVNINLIGTFNVTRLVAHAMANIDPGSDGERGVIVNTASIAAYEGQIGQAAYAASKGGVASMTLPIARDLASMGIRVVCIAPGLFDTPLMDMLPEEVKEGLASSVPYPKVLGKPEWFAALVKAVLENPYMNGETIRLDGALRMPPR